MLVSRTVLPVMAALALVPLAACGSSDDTSLAVASIGQADDPFRSGVRLPPAGQLVRAATVEGLVAFDEQGRVIPALADRWIVTDDGQSYIFRLRDGNWSGGDPITADSVRKPLLAALKALGDDTPLALDLEGIDQIRSMAGRVIEVRLKRPMPFLLQLLAQPELGLIHDGTGSGPMTLSKTGKIATLRPIDPTKLGLPAVEDWANRTRMVSLRALSGAAAVEAFNAGDVDLVLGGQIQDFPLTRSVGILRGTIQLDPVVGLFGLQIMNAEGFLAAPANREALAMAIDREGLMSPFGVGGWTPSARIVTPSLDGDLGVVNERWKGETLDQRRAVAGGRVRAWIAAHGGPQVGLRLRIALPEGEGSQTLFARLSSDLATIGVTLERVKDSTAADFTLVDDVARYPRAAWFLNRLSCHARRGLCSAEADALVAEAGSEAASPAQRAVLLTDAEQQLTAANVYIPFGPPIRWSLVRGTVSGFGANQWGWHPLMPLALLPK
ncbi:extracellular solute-binding protein [Novosphingobium sp. Rr 2-17]|uniref:ABC transporter substrate-binding protein n=1 Tax=Novosphingobium sp. Rr 2-17 TaxID=555793 RepID=UPI000269823B|nr:ABC transporter substrate-binding protein [Novosphingobium sp. Rr 2-17]EIZ78268.1 extracellular solute-binding protein [Novosphingobium sp. Rr 2-17]